jgi:UrcA family protein
MIVRTPSPRPFLVAAVASLALLSGITQAATPTASRTVQYGDLNLATTAGQRALQQRVRGAARQVCAPLEGQGLRERRDWRACRAQAIAGAQAALPNRPLAVRAADRAATPAR